MDEQMKRFLEYVLMLGGTIMIISMVAVVVLLLWRPRGIVLGVKLTAWSMARKRWRVRAVVHLQNGGVALRLFSWWLGGNQELYLPFRPGHPDIKKLRELMYGDVIWLRFADESGDFALETEICAYLRLKNVEQKTVQ